MRRSWQEITAAKRASRDRVIEEYSRSDKPPRLVEVTSIEDISELRKLLISGSLTAEDAIQAYIER